MVCVALSTESVTDEDSTDDTAKPPLELFTVTE